MKFFFFNIIMFIFLMENSMAENYEIKYNGNNFNIPENLLIISDAEKFNINSNFSKLEIMKLDEIMSLAYLPLNLEVSGSFEKDYLNIELLIENFTSEKWFIPSPLMYHGNRYLTLVDDIGIYHYPDIIYKHRVVTNDETIFVVEKGDKVKISYKLNLNERLCENVTKLYIEHRFLPVFLINDDKYVVERRSLSAVVKSGNYLKIDCKNREIISFDNN